MKAAIHPTYFDDTKVTCRSCGKSFVTGSTKQQITVEVCSQCHPFFTGEHRFLDTKGRVEDFQRKQQAAQEYKQKASIKKKKDEKSKTESKSLKELLSEV
ncbi:MAG: hypothetical protein RI947_174 [Candidatus Parcubacteria bacterium]|jgi:large subunit ribosomal protein L31